MSMTTSVGLLAKMSIEPDVPASTMAVLPTINPSGEFTVAASGRGWPVGYAVMKPRGAGGTTVMLREYACAVVGIEHVVLDCTGNVLLLPPTSAGAPNGPENPCEARVSTTRHGVIAMNARASVVLPAAWGVASFGSTCDGCQNAGAAQFLIRRLPLSVAI